MNNWEFFGRAGHFIGSNYCRFHLTTKVGKYLVSTIGEYIPNDTMEDIGWNRKYETMVFKIGEGICNCGCQVPTIIPTEIEMNAYNYAKDAHKGHYKMCEKYEK